MIGTSHLFIHKLSNIYRKYQIFLSIELKPYNLHPSTYPILMGVLAYPDEGLLQDDLCKLIGLAKSVVTKAIKELEANDYVYRTESKHSKRHKLVFPKQKALDLEPMLYQIAYKWNTMITESMSEKDIENLANLLDMPYTNSLYYHVISPSN